MSKRMKSPEYQPELSYTRRETQELVHEMINTFFGRTKDLYFNV